MRTIVRNIIILLCIHRLHAQTTFQAHRAGSWYPRKPEELLHTIQTLSSNAEKRFDMETDGTKIRAIIAPHAGYTYSGTVAAAVYNLVAHNPIARIIILGPSHFKPLQGIALPTFDSYQTPLGTLTVYNKGLRKLHAQSPLITSSDDYFTPEHSIEMQLPFIQYALPAARIIPIIVGHLADADVTKIASLLKPLITKQTLVIVSSDFTHYGANFDYVPFAKNIRLNIDQLDSSVLDPIQHQNRAAFETVISKTHDTVCGFEPIRILLELINQETWGPVTVRLVAHDTSYEVSRDEQSIVSYASLIVTNEMNNNLLNQQEQRSLLQYAKNTLQESFQQTIPTDLLKPIMTPLLEKPQGAFTTLRIKGEKQLRGCIGQVYPDKPLYQIVAATVLDTAFRDMRFSPVQQKELPNISIEISVLKEPKSIASYKKIRLNEEGIILTHGDHSALFLPKVPGEFGFNLTQTLEELSKKAGLPKDVWKSPETTFQVFKAQDFEE